MRRHHLDDEQYIVIERGSGGLGSFFLGLALGAGVALLLAPQSGAATRRDLKRRARRARRAAEQAVEQVTDTVTDTFSEARQRVEDQIAAARAAIDLKKGQFSRAVEAGRAAAHDAREDLERRLAETKADQRRGASPARSRPAAAARRRAAAEDEIA